MTDMANILFPSNKVYSMESSIHGLGVFAREDIHEGEVIEECPIIPIPEEQLSNLVKTELLEYYFAWGAGFKEGAVCLGFGSLYNHTYDGPNAKYIKDLENKVIRFVAIKPIARDSEILVNYNGHPEDKTKLWFEARHNR
jgi:uncharacterized protein